MKGLLKVLGPSKYLNTVTGQLCDCSGEGVAPIAPDRGFVSIRQSFCKRTVIFEWFARAFVPGMWEHLLW